MKRVSMEEREGRGFYETPLRLLHVRLFISFIITKPVRQDVSWPALRAKYILQSFSMKVSSYKEFMCHSVKKVGSGEEKSFISFPFSKNVAYE